MKYLGIDYGSKNIGLAISDSSGVVAMPYLILNNNRDFLGEIEKIIEKEKIEAFVFGESKNFKGEDNKINIEIKKVAKEFEEKFKLPVYFVNEIFSSMESKWGVEKSIRRGEKKSRKSRGEGKVDSKAAALILKIFLKNPKK